MFSGNPSFFALIDMLDARDWISLIVLLVLKNLVARRGSNVSVHLWHDDRDVDAAVFFKPKYFCNLAMDSELKQSGRRCVSHVQNVSSVNIWTLT